MNNKLSDLIEALNIFLKYGDVSYPTNCSHDTLRIFPGDENISENDLELLEKLGFVRDDDITESFISTLFGSN